MFSATPYFGRWFVRVPPQSGILGVYIDHIVIKYKFVLVQTADFNILFQTDRFYPNGQFESFEF
jgi:hypothetical protein